MATTVSPLLYIFPTAFPSSSQKHPSISHSLKMFNAGASSSSNSGKRKMKEVVRQQSPPPPPPPATRNQFDLFRFNAGSGNGNHYFPSSSHFPPHPPHRFSSPSQLTPHHHRFPSPSSNGAHKFLSPRNLTPLFNGAHRFPPPPPPSNSQYYRFASPPNALNPLSKDHHFPTHFITPPRRRQSRVERILNSAAPTIRPYTFTSLLMADDDDEEEEEEDPIVAEMRSQTEQINQMITVHAKLLGNAVGGMLESQQKSIRHAAEEQAAKKVKEKEKELRAKTGEQEELERKVEQYKKEAEKLSAKVKYLEDYTESLKVCLGRATSVTCNKEDSSSSMMPKYVDPETVGGAIIVQCMVCDTQLASVMMLPCRHVSVCMRCNADAKLCPVCRKPKLSCAQVWLCPI